LQGLARSIADALTKVLQSLERQGIRYFLGGSIASSIHGVQRSTRDIDIVADLTERQVDILASELRTDFYIDAETAKDSVRRGRPFNLIHFASSHKFDIFPMPADDYHRRELERAKPELIDLAEGVSIQSYVASAEDIILSKLVWYRSGGEQSEQQWNDLRGVLAVSGAALDRDYLANWARYLRVDDLLAKLLVDEVH
jgi:hypothetical protein